MQDSKLVSAYLKYQYVSNSTDLLTSLLLEHEYSSFYFTAPDCLLQTSSNSLRCDNCSSILRRLRDRSRRRSNENSYTPGMTDKYVLHSPTRVQEKLIKQRRILKTVREKLYWTRKQYDTYIQDHGIKISSKQAELIFDAETERAYKRILDAKNGEFDDLPQKDLISYLCKVSWENVRLAKKSGKKAVEFCPIVLKFAHYVKSQMNNSSYSFLANVFNLPSISTLNKKSAYDTNTEDGLMHETMKSMEEDFNHHFKDKEIIDWDRMGILKFDEMKIKEKMVFNPHTNEIIGFTDPTLTVDVLKSELETMDKDVQEGKRTKPQIAKNILVFMFERWDGEPMKRVVARYSVGKANGEFLHNTILHVISGLASRGFIVNQISSDGATENVSALSQLANIKASELFQLRDWMPDMHIAFKHPVSPTLVFVGGEMSHWIKKFVNAMENSSLPENKSKRNMRYGGGEIKLSLIEEVWRDTLLDFNFIRTSKLTEEHFDKNAHSRMRVHFAVQVLSKSVIEMIEGYISASEEVAICRSKYKSLLQVMEKLDVMVDIWNHYTDKVFIDGERYGPIKKEKDIDIQNHKYITYLEDILILFSKWEKETKNLKTYKTDFMPSTLYKSFAWLVYGIKGVASQIPDGCQMMQRRGGTDEVEQEFSRIRAGNSNSTMADTRGIIASGSSVRGNYFAKAAKANTGDRKVYMRQLWTIQKNRIRNIANKVKCV